MSGFLVLRMRNPFGWRWRANRASLKRCKQHLFLTLRALSGSNPSFLSLCLLMKKAPKRSSSIVLAEEEGFEPS